MIICPPKLLPSKALPRQGKVSLWQYASMFRRDILSAQPARLYGAWMAEFKTPFFWSYLLNQPDLIKTFVKNRPLAFPESNRIGAGLRPLLDNSVFVTNGAEWQRQRRIIDPAFQGATLKQTFPAMWQAGLSAVARLQVACPPDNTTEIEIEAETSHAAADVIFRTLFSLPITDRIAA